MAQIKLSIDNTLLKLLSPFDLVSNQVGYDTCLFEFGTEWTGYTKTAVFYSEKSDKTEVLLNETNTCIIPWENIIDSSLLYIGVYGVKDTIVVSTNFVILKMREGAWDPYEPLPPKLDIYAQVINSFNDIRVETTANKNAAADSATAAASSASNANQSETNAANSAQSASNMATNALNSANTASDIEENVYQSEYNASQSAIAAATSAQTATEAATKATTIVQGKLGINDSSNSTTEVLSSAKVNSLLATKVTWVTPQMFGAIGDGISDDTTAITNAIAYCKANKKELFIPIGIYNVTSNFTIDFPLTIRGAKCTTVHENSNNISYGSVINDVSTTDNSADTYLFTFAVSNTESITIKDLMIEGNGASKSAIYLDHAGWTFTAENICIDNFKGHALSLNRQYDSNLINITIERCGSMINSSPAYAIWISSLDGSGNSNAIHFVNLHMEFCRYYIYTKFAQDIVFSNSKFEMRRNTTDSYYGIDTDITNPMFSLRSEQSANISFNESTFCIRGDYAWKLVNTSMLYTNVPYAFSINHVDSETDYSSSLFFNNCMIFSPDADGGFRFLQSNTSVGHIEVNNCFLYNLSLLASPFSGNNIRLKECILHYYVHSSILSYDGIGSSLTNSNINNCLLSVKDTTINIANNKNTLVPIVISSGSVSNNDYSGFIKSINNFTTNSTTLATTTGVIAEAVIPITLTVGLKLLTVNITIPSGGTAGRIQTIININGVDLAYRNTSFTENTYKDTITVPINYDKDNVIKVTVLQNSGQSKTVTIDTKVINL